MVEKRGTGGVGHQRISNAHCMQAYRDLRACHYHTQSMSIKKSTAIASMKNSEGKAVVYSSVVR